MYFFSGNVFLPDVLVQQDLQMFFSNFQKGKEERQRINSAVRKRNGKRRRMQEERQKKRSGERKMRNDGLQEEEEERQRQEAAQKWKKAELQEQQRIEDERLRKGWLSLIRTSIP